MQKTRRLMDENDVSFQMFLILMSIITIGSESQFLYLNNVKAIQVLRCLLLRVGASAEAKISCFFQ